MIWGRRIEADFNNPESLKKFPLISWMILGCVVGLIFTVIGFFILKNSWDVKNNWLDISAIITESKVELYENKEHNDLYRGVINYEYQIGEEKFSGTHLTAGSSLPSLAESWKADYRVGEKIAIKVNPQYKYQSKSVAEADDWVGNYLMLFLGMVLFFSFGGAGIYGIKKRRRFQMMESNRIIKGSIRADKDNQNNFNELTPQRSARRGLPRGFNERKA